MDFKLYFHSISYPKESVSETKHLHYYPVHGSDPQLGITNRRSHNPKLLSKNRGSLFAVLKHFQLEASNQLCRLQFQNYPAKMTFNAYFTQGLKKMVHEELQMQEAKTNTTNKK